MLRGLPLTFLIGILLVWNAVLTYFYVSSVRHYKKLRDEKTGYSLHEILNSFLIKQMKNENKLKDIEQLLKKMGVEGLNNVSGLGFVRFNPYGDTGGNQSFSLAILNRRDDGIVISSLHGRAGTRVYAKPIKSGEKEKYEFSEEEKQAILIAKKTKL